VGVVATVGPRALASRGHGSGKGAGGKTTTSGATLSGPTDTHVGDTYRIVGSGFQPGIGVTLSVGEAGGCCYSVMVGTEADGTFAYTGNVWGTGTYSFQASVPTNKGYQLAASYSFQAS
jgi:hypothetical protein